MRSIVRLAALILLSCVLQPAHFAYAAESPQPVRQPVWSVAGAKNTVYLLGSVHFLSASEQLPAAVEHAYEDAEKLVMEIDLDDLGPAEMQQTALELALLPEGESLEERLGQELYSKIAERARELGLEPRVLNRFHPWFVALTLAQSQLMKMGLDPASGVEQRLAARAAQDRKPIEGLESVREQLGFLARLPDRQQKEFLLYSLEDVERAEDDVAALLAAWRRGDADALAAMLAEGFEQFPDLYAPLTVNRNRKWLPKIDALLDDEDDYLVVVGALHLVGEDSVIDLLRKNGREVVQH